MELEFCFGGVKIGLGFFSNFGPEDNPEVAPLPLLGFLISPLFLGNAFDSFLTNTGSSYFLSVSLSLSKSAGKGDTDAYSLGYPLASSGILSF